MKKLVLLIAIALAACSLYADYEYLNSSFTGGFSTVNGNPTIGFGSSYQVLAMANNRLSFGVGAKTDVDIALSDIVDGLSFGTFFGPAFEIKLSKTTSFNLASGLSFYVEDTFEKDSNEYNSLGLGFDASFNCYFDTEDNMGLALGVSGYLSFMGLDEYSRGFCSDISAYVGISTRFFDEDTSLRDEYLDFFFY